MINKIVNVVCFEDPRRRRPQDHYQLEVSFSLKQILILASLL